MFIVLKNLNVICKSYREDATKTVLLGDNYTKEVLINILNDLDQKDLVKIVSKRLNKSMRQLEVTFYIIFWNDI